jgi:hypothetical protein
MSLAKSNLTVPKKIRGLLSEPLKKIIRFVYYRNERKKVFREIKIRRRQNELLLKQFEPTCKNLIVFFVHGADWFTGEDSISGGILSIASIYEETKKLEPEHHCKVIMVTYEDAHLLLEHTKFPNEIMVYRFDQLFLFFKQLDKLIIHVADYLALSVGKSLLEKRNFLSKIPDLQFNVLNQNIRLMPQPEEISFLKNITSKVTQTTAHEQYATQEMRVKYDMPLHLLSVFGSPEKYKRIEFEKKENLIIVSPDEMPLKESILNKIRNQLPDFKIVIIKDMPYKTYLDYVSKAKFAITFGEGLDFYFIETIFSGGVGIAGYNTDFFTEPFSSLDGLFVSYSDMENRIIDFLKKYNLSNYFKEANQKQFDEVSKIYKYKEYVENIRKFYRREYTLN